MNPLKMLLLKMALALLVYSVSFVFANKAQKKDDFDLSPISFFIAFAITFVVLMIISLFFPLFSH